MPGSSEQSLSEFVWQTRYRDPDADPPERSIGDSWQRVAHAVAAIEQDPPYWSEQFLGILRNFRFMPGGRILAGAGTTRRVTLCNCFVMGLIDDSIEGIFESLKEGALTMQEGGGVGYDFSTLRPRGARARTTGVVASGPVSFMRVWDAMCATVMSTGARRGAMMATLRCDHPDIEEFIDAKSADCLERFNLSVLVSDAFMDAVRSDAEWPLVFPVQHTEQPAAPTVTRAWSGHPAPVACSIYRTRRARELWRRLCDRAYASADPGVLFIDRINAHNNLGYCESISATNPCAEEPLPAFGACNLGSLNLTAFVLDPFTPRARFDHAAIEQTARVAVRFLDNVIDITHFPLLRQRDQAHHSRRLGLGISGLADALAMLALPYDTEPARQTTATVMRAIRDAAYATSVQLARERGPFPAFDRGKYPERPFILGLPTPLQADIGRYGMRNSHLLAIAPTGTISLLAGNISSGIEPIFGLEMQRRVLDADGTPRNFLIADYAYAAWRATQRGQGRLGQEFRDSATISARDHLLMQAALQPYVDGAIAKTVMLSPAATAAGVVQTFEDAYDLNLKGCTVFREAARRGVIAGPYPGDPGQKALSVHCCDVGRESD